MEKVNLFISYSHADKDSLERLTDYVNEKDCPNVNIWFDEAISLGTSWDDEIKQRLNDSQIVLLILSENFINSIYINNVELITALWMQKQGICRVVPIFAKNFDLESHPELSELLSRQGFPRDQRRPFNKMKEAEKAAQYKLFKSELNQAVKDVLREKVRNRLSLLKRDKIFLSVPQSDKERETRSRFVSEVEQKRKYEHWNYQIIPSDDEIRDFNEKFPDEQAALISEFQIEALYSIQLVQSDLRLEAGPAKPTSDPAIKSSGNYSIYRKIIWAPDGAVAEKSLNPRVCGDDSQKVFEIISSLDEEKEREIAELEDFLRDKKNVFMFYDFKKDNDNKTRRESKTFIEEYTNDHYKNIDLRLEVSRPNGSFKREEKFLESCHGGFIFYGNADPYWFARRQALLLDSPAKQAKCICIDEPEIEEKLKRDVTIKPFATDKFFIIRGRAELELRMKQFCECLLKET